MIAPFPGLPSAAWVQKTWLRIYSDGGRFTCGTSLPASASACRAATTATAPAEAGLDHDHLQFRVPLEHALQHDAGKRGLLALRMADHLLDIKTRPARRGDRLPKTEGVDADRETRLLRRLIDRPVAALPSGSTLRLSSSTWTKFLSPARRRIRQPRPRRPRWRPRQSLSGGCPCWSTYRSANR